MNFKLSKAEIRERLRTIILVLSNLMKIWNVKDLKKYIFIYLFLAALGLLCCVGFL